MLLATHVLVDALDCIIRLVSGVTRPGVWAKTLHDMCFGEAGIGRDASGICRLTACKL